MGSLNDASAPLSAATAAAATTLLTLSYRGDYELCCLLCETVERFVPAEVAHVVAVPKGDMRLFAGLANARRRLVEQESLLPGWLLKVPMPGPEWRARLHLPRRNMYLSLKGRPVRGWIAQQIMKLSAGVQCGRDIILHVDSDAAFIRPLDGRMLVDGGKVRLLRIPGEGQTPMHAAWHEAASTLLGLPRSPYHGADYIDNGVTWRRPVLQRLLGHVEAATGMDWRLALCRAGEFSEYVLYGAYCDAVLGLEAAGHYGAPFSLSNTLWPEQASEGADIVGEVRPHHLTLGIQSTIPTTMDRRRRLTEAAIARAAAQDA